MQIYYLMPDYIGLLVPCPINSVPFIGNVLLQRKSCNSSINLSGTGKSEIRISKLETNSNEKNINHQTENHS